MSGTSGISKSTKHGWANGTQVKFQPDLDRGDVIIELENAGDTSGATLDIEISFKGSPVVKDQIVLTDRYTKRSFNLLRKVHIENGMVYLNNKPYYQKLVLDQGYWQEGLLTAPTDEDLRKDIELAKEMGFNGCRKHQKVEDPRFLYWADKLGFIVIGRVRGAADLS